MNSVSYYISRKIIYNYVLIIHYSILTLVHEHEWQSLRQFVAMANDLGIICPSGII